MPFIGQEPITGAYSVLDDITTSATATYNLQKNSVAYSPASANHLLVSLNGVIQKPGSSFTISGSQITFSEALTAQDSIDFIMALGDVLSVGTPTDGSVTNEKVSTGINASKISAGTLPLDTLPSGSIIQVVSNSFQGTEATSTNTTYATTPEALVDGMQTEIRVKDASSKILILMNINLLAQRLGPANAFGTIGFDDDTTSGVSKSASDYSVISSGSSVSAQALYANRRNVSAGASNINAATGFSSTGTMQFLHTHGKAVDTYLYYTALSLTTYTNSSASYIYNVLGSRYHITLMEIKA